MLNFSMVVSGGAAVTYLLDTHGANALHILSITNFAKNMVLYGSTFFANGIIVSRGVKVSLLILGACQAVCWLASVPMYVYGKRVRSFVSACTAVTLPAFPDRPFRARRPSPTLNGLRADRAPSPSLPRRPPGLRRSRGPHADAGHPQRWFRARRDREGLGLARREARRRWEQ